MENSSWVKGGIIASVICAILFGFYAFLYFPLVEQYAREAEERNGSHFALVLPVMTGHILPMLSHFAIEGSSIPDTLCKETETTCLHWSSEYGEGGMSWIDGEGGAGYCLEQDIGPARSCVERIQSFAMIGAGLILEMAYFIIGAVIAIGIARRKKM